MTPSKKAREVLELCLASESDELRSKVYEIISLSGLNPDDPLFLVLALTGQIKVFLETAPRELQQLLLDWRQQNAESLSQIYTAVDLVNSSHEEILVDLKQTLEQVSFDYISNIKEVGMATVSAIADANSETIEQIEQTKVEVRELVQEVASLRSSYAADRQKSSDEIAATFERLEQTISKFDRADTQIRQALFAAKKLQQQQKWQQQARWYTPLLALVIVSFCSAFTGSWVTARAYNSPAERFKRDLWKYNQQRLTECLNSRQDKCTVEIMSSDRP